MTIPRPRKPRDIETFRDRRAKKRRSGTTIGALTVKLTFDASAFAPVEVIDRIREIATEEAERFHARLYIARAAKDAAWFEKQGLIRQALEQELGVRRAGSEHDA